MANPGRVLKTWVSGCDFKKPGYPGQVSGFQKCTKLAIFGWKNCQIGAFCEKIDKFHRYLKSAWQIISKILFFFIKLWSYFDNLKYVLLVLFIYLACSSHWGWQAHIFWLEWKKCTIFIIIFLTVCLYFQLHFGHSK